MIVLHAGVEGQQFLLWGETPADTPSNKVTGRTRRKTPTPFPFDPGAKPLAELVADVLPSWQRPRGKPPTRFAWLPAVKGAPVPSHPLIGPAPGKGKPALAPWTLHVVTLDPPDAVEFLCACINREMLRPGVRVGSTLAFWTQALRFAASLVAREQFVPGVEQQEGDWFARWQPVLAGAQAEALTALARNMPPACRALSPSAETPPEHPAREVLSGFVAALVDTLVRTGLAPEQPEQPEQREPRPRRRRRRRRARKVPAFDSVHDRWLYALRSRDGSLTPEGEDGDGETARLAEQVRTWQRPIALTAAAAFRLCFRLEEPRDGEGTWTVRYLLQGREDPSLLVPVADAWSPRGSLSKVFARQRFEPREYLLTALGQAASLCPPVEASLELARPSAFPTNATGAFHFLSDSAVLLEQAGFGVQLPGWWTRKGTRQRLAARAIVRPTTQTAGSGLSLDQVVTFDWQLALGDQTLSVEELEALARLKAPLVQVRGEWVQLDPDQIEAALEFWKRQGQQQATAREVVQLALGMGDIPAGLDFAGVSAEGWIGDLLAQLEGTHAYEELPSPEGFIGTLRPYQVRGYSWLAFLGRWSLGACLADDMGLGKTIQTLALIQRDWQGEDSPPTLLVCPTSVVGNWKKEAERFTPELPVLIHHGQQRERGSAFARKVAGQALVLTSYSLLHRDRALFESVRWAAVVLDEAQNIKNPQTKQAQSARALQADARIALTGTPVENHVGELWSIMEFLNPGFLGSQAGFRRNFFIPIQAQRDPEAIRGLQKLTRPFILRRLKTDKEIIADLPDKLEMKVYCNLTREQVSLYEAVVRNAQKELSDSEGIQRRGVILGLLSKLKQVCNHPAHFLKDNSELPGRSGKLARLTEMLEEVLEASERVLLFTQFTEMGDLLKRHLEETFGQEVLFLHGGVPARKRGEMVARFQSPDGPPLFLLSLKAGGTGLNLTAANHVFHFDRWWNPAVEDQATDRAFRIGQTRNVQVHKFVCVGTFEERIDDMIERKKEVAGKVVGAGEAWLTELSDNELKDLFTLREEALGD
jgi:SNF2 family DNA or RNA helicase